MMELGLSVEMVASWMPGSRVEGTAVAIRDIASPDRLQPGDLCFIGDRKHVSEVAGYTGVCLVVGSDWEVPIASGNTLIRVADPMKAMIEVCLRVERMLWPLPDPGIHASSLIATGAYVSPAATVGPFVVIEAGASIGDGVVLDAHAFVGAHVSIGKGTRVGPNTVLGAYTEIGKNCIIGPGVVIGTPGFGYRFDVATDSHVAIPQIGRVRVEDCVEMGANCAIDRARVGESLIGRGTKIDNLVHIGHNVKIGKACILCGQVGISGSVCLGDYVVMGGQAGVGDHIRVAPKSQIGGKTGVISNIDEEGGKYFGIPAMELNVGLRVASLQKRLPELFKRVNQLEQEIRNKGQE